MQRSSISRRVALGRGFGVAASLAWANRSGQAAPSAGSTTVSVRDFGAKGDGRTDDRQAFQKAINHLHQATKGPKTLLVPSAENFYSIHGRVTPVGCHDLSIVGEGRNARLVGTAPDRAPFSTWHPGRLPDRDLLPNDQRADGTPFFAVLPLAGEYEPGMTTLNLAEAPQPREIAVDDYLFIRTGDVAKIAELSVPHPIAEYNQVVAIDGRSLSLRWPLAKYYQSMGDGHLYGVAVITRLVTRGLRLRNLEFHHEEVRGAHLFNFIDLEVENCRFTGNSSLAARGRFMKLDIRSDITPVSDQWRPYHLALDTGTSHVDFKLVGRSAGSGIVHLHEALASVSGDIEIANAERDEVQFGTKKEVWGTVSIRSISWDIHLRSVKITNSPSGSAVDSDASQVYPTWGNWNLRIDQLTVEGVVNGRPLVHGPDQPPLTLGAVDVRRARATQNDFGSGQITSNCIESTFQHPPDEPISAGSFTQEIAAPSGASFAQMAIVELELEELVGDADAMRLALTVASPSSPSPPPTIHDVRWKHTGLSFFLRQAAFIPDGGPLSVSLLRSAPETAPPDTPKIKRVRTYWVA